MEKSCFKGRFCSKAGFNKDCHSQFCRAQHLGIFRILSSYAKKGNTLCDNNKYVEDPRLQASGMTALCNGAFTLIELLVVVLIIGILAAVAVPQYQKAVDRSRIKGILPVMRAVINAENLYKLEHGAYTYNWQQLGIDIPHTQLNYHEDSLYLTDGSYYYLSDEGTYPHVAFFTPTDWVSIYAAFSTELWLCYPKGTARGKALCKSLGCTDEEVEKHHCVIVPSR